MPTESRQLLGQIRNELNTSWGPAAGAVNHLPPAVDRAGAAPGAGGQLSGVQRPLRLLTVQLDYQLPPRFVPSHQAIHLLQIAREALSNALKHASATEVTVTVSQRDNQVRLVVADNGRGVPDHAERSNHYGLIIMRDRAQSLRGDCQVRRRETGGTEVIVTFIPEKTFFHPIRRPS